MSANRAARRRLAKESKKNPQPDERVAKPVGDGQIVLENPVEEHFPAFIVGNAQYCDHVAQENSAKGQHIVICGAGPSLAEHAHEFCPDADQVWGCNSAATYLGHNGHRVTHAFTCDQTAQMVNEWYDAPKDIEYLIASSVHPHLVEFLLRENRRMTFFHNFVGIKRRPVGWYACSQCGWAPGDNSPTAMCPACDVQVKGQLASYEDWLYMTLYPGTVRAGSGLNAVTRAIDIARYVGAGKITVLGADCALRIKSKPPEGVEFGSEEHMRWLREDTQMHADGGNALASDATPMTLGATIDSGTPDDEIREGHGRYWQTKIDLLVSAVWLKKMEEAFPEVTIVGDTLTAALRGKTDDYLSKLPTFVDADGNPIPIQVC